MSFMTALKSYFDAIEYGKSEDELFELREHVLGGLNEYTSTDELKEAKDFLSLYKQYGDRTDSIAQNNLLMNMSKSIVKGALIGGGLGLFIHTNQRLALLGGLLGFEVSALKFQYLKYSIKKIANELDAQLDQVLSGVEPTSSFSM